MDTERHRETESALDRAHAAEARRLRALNDILAGEAESAREALRRAHAERDRADDELRDVSVRYIESQVGGRRVERERRLAEADLARARAHIEKTQPILREARTLLHSMQSSKFWKLRNAWFALRSRLRLRGGGPQPYWVPEVDDTADVWDRDAAYDGWLLANRVGPSAVRRMRDMLPLFRLRPVFSIIMPVYNAPEAYLRAAIESVLEQVYPDWELCIADDASTQPHVRPVLEELAATDPRIRVVFREQNGHIVAASNSALAVAGGEFVALLDHDDALAADALFENALVVNRRPDVDIIYSDEDKLDEAGKRRDPYFKPDWAPDSLLARNYVSHLGVYRRSLVNEVGGFRPGFEGSQDYDLLLRASERTERIAHIPRVLYHWRIHPASTASQREQKDYAYDAALRALAEALERRGEPGRFETNARIPGIYTVRYAITKPGRVSIIVPTRDHGEDVDRCLRSVFERSTYADLEVILLDNGSKDREALRTFGAWAECEQERLKIVAYDVPFNFSKINNYAASHASGDYLIFLNNDTEVITPDWIEAMVEQAQRPSIGAVGAKLLYDDRSVQHAGVIIGIGGVAGHSHKYALADEPGYFATLQTVNNVSAVTAACLAIRRETFDAVGRFDEELAIAFNDVDFCLRVREAGYRNVYLPHVELYHHESRSRGVENTPEKMARFLREQQIMRRRWRTDAAPDPYYNPNLSLITENYAIGP